MTEVRLNVSQLQVHLRGGVVDTVRDVILELGLGGHHEDTLEDNT